MSFKGISSTLGGGIYVTAGQVIKDAGPIAFVSFLIAGFCSFLAGIAIYLFYFLVKFLEMLY